MRWLRDGLLHAPAYLWSGWGAIASLLLFLAAWEWASVYYGSLVLPDPRATLARLSELLAEGAAWTELAVTAHRALVGFALAVVAGSLLGMLTGRSMTASMMSRPIITVLIGTPPIAWLVLALLWFGAGDGTPIFTVFVAAFPIVFIGAMQGARTLDGQLHDMAVSFRLPWRLRFSSIYLPQLLAFLFPAWITALGVSWKVVVMAELLASDDGVGAMLAVTRSHLDTAATLAWVCAIVGILLLVEYLLLEPIRRELESWRVAS
ncbi:MAG: ABC transporter permease, partial [Halothiobacillaceae bacterium]